MEDSDRAAVAALLAPLSVDEFISDIWPDTYYNAHGPLERLPNFLQHSVLSTLENLFTHYRGRVLFGKGTSGPRSFLMEHAHPSHLYRMGLSLYLPDVEPIIPGATEFLRSLERVCKVEAGCGRITAWASPAEEGIACHYDPEDVFSIQLQGEKHFHVAPQAAIAYPIGSQYGPGHPPSHDHYLQCGAGFPQAGDAVFEDIVMRPGSVLFIPRGHWHRTYAAANSLSVSIVLAPKSLAERVLAELRSLMMQDPQWRRPIYGEPQLSSSTLSKLGDLTQRITLAAFAPKEAPPQGLQYADQDRFQKVPDWTAGYSADGDYIRLRIDPPVDSDEYSGFFEAQVPRECSCVIDWLKRHNAAFSISQLREVCGALEPETLDELLAYFVSVKFLHVLHFDLL